MKFEPINHELNTPCDDCDRMAACMVISSEATQKSLSLCSSCAMELFWLLADNREKE